MPHSSHTPEGYEKQTHTGSDHDKYIHSYAGMDGPHVYTNGPNSKVSGHPVIHTGSHSNY